MFKVAGKDGVLGWGHLNGLECKVKKDWRLEDRVRFPGACVPDGYEPPSMAAGTELRSSARAMQSLNSPVPLFFFKVQLYLL